MTQETFNAAAKIIIDTVAANPGIDFRQMVYTIQDQTNEFNGFIFGVTRELVRQGKLVTDGSRADRLTVPSTDPAAAPVDAQLLGAELVAADPSASAEWRAAAKQVIEAKALARKITDEGDGTGRKNVRCDVVGDRYVFSSPVTTPHSLDITTSSEERVRAHWLGYCANVKTAFEAPTVDNYSYKPGTCPECGAALKPAAGSDGWVCSANCRQPNSEEPSCRGGCDRERFGSD